MRKLLILIVALAVLVSVSSASAFYGSGGGSSPTRTSCVKPGKNVKPILHWGQCKTKNH